VAQLFNRGSNTLAKVIIVGAFGSVIGLVAAALLIDRSPFVSNQGVAFEQPVPFSHEHHVRGLGIDCRYCHTGVEVSPFAGLPSTKTCMTCHSQIWTNAALLEPVRAAFRDNKPIQWTRVHNLPHYVYFNHSIHIAKGVACVTCHGPVQFMPLMYQQNTLHMHWCLECHRHPERSVGARENVFKTNWQNRDDDDVYKMIHQLVPARQTGDLEKSEPDQTSGEDFVKKYAIKGPNKLTDCYTCHR
jgi:hypothetical protein